MTAPFERRAEGLCRTPDCAAPLRPCCLACPACDACHAQGCAGLPPGAVCTCGCLIEGQHREWPAQGCRTMPQAGPLVCPCAFARLAPDQPATY